MAFVDTFIALIVVDASDVQTTWPRTSYTNKSHTRIYFLLAQLNQVTKDDEIIAEYI